MDTEDQRDVELSTLSAIYPEIQRVQDGDPYTFILEVPVTPSKAVTVFFPAAAEGQALGTAAPQIGDVEPNGNIDSHELAHLPALRLQISLPPTYPVEEPPAVHLSTSPSWLPLTTAKKVESDCARLWEDLGRDLVVFSYVDHVQQLADEVFGLVSDVGALEIRPEHKIAVLDYDIEAKRRAFDKETFECGVCLDPKKGAKCHRMLDCGHVFCIECLRDFYNNAIKEGDLASVRCLEPSCAKKRETAQAPDSKKRRKPKTYLSPSELLQIPLDSETVKRYVTLKYKTELESDKNVIYCPREGCQGAARSKKHKKPEGFELHETEEDSDPEDEHPVAESSEPPKPTMKPFKLEDRLAVCEDCGFAFCSRCYKGWHGDYVICHPSRGKEELSEEEKASLEFISLHTTPCPTCACPAQKTHGCNHMICYRCQTHFCYLCSAWLDPANPYQHFNQLPNGRRTACYMRLWELEEGDENGENVFAGGRGHAIRPPAFEEAAVAEAAVLPGVIGGGGAVVEGNVRPEREPVALGGDVAVAQEGPLVLRLGAGVLREGRGGQQQVAAPPAPRQQPVRGHPRGVPRQQQQPQAHPGQRGRGARARGAGRRQDVNPHANRAQNQGNARRDPHILEQVRDAAGQHDQMEDGDAAWIRHFVHLALEDNEDLIDEDD
ncbi:hypothetical protein N0V93_006671 [Gnomoniopsis smithogilvyi]|uniref:RBR-type E3 ubiquitin transferase n=1 Tax=Gnomoniopsis smithogilvyi TaxID=1191159 RepID=A0A9W9CUP7_9PEZI|nr:hypothetical protein N0V93_006671 [Gnomoniopsis smithogilvyi]